MCLTSGFVYIVTGAHYLLIVNIVTLGSRLDLQSYSLFFVSKLSKGYKGKRPSLQGIGTRLERHTHTALTKRSQKHITRSLISIPFKPWDNLCSYLFIFRNHGAFWFARTFQMVNQNKVIVLRHALVFQLTSTKTIKLMAESVDNSSSEGRENSDYDEIISFCLF